jgi:superfamily I DNA and/or RNA helicase
VSCVRSNKEGKIGFCNEENRLNVTLTRARRGIVLVGNKKTFLSEAEEPNVWH